VVLNLDNRARQREVVAVVTGTGSSSEGARER
jgi:hypothetical protein